MKPDTIVELQLYYGELMHELENCNDYFRKIRINKKMKSIECLLDIEFIT